MNTPKTNEKANEILRDVERMKFDGWNDAYHEMRRHAEILEEELASMTEDRDYYADRMSG